jgi:ADP-ribose pyrophosphatase
MKRHPLVELRSSALLHRGRAFDVVRERIALPSGLEQDLVIVDHPGAVGVLAIDGERRVLLVRQYRHAVGDWLVEIPAGRIESGESALNAAQRELEEETGLHASAWSDLGGFYAAPGFCSEWMHLFAAEDLTDAGPGRAGHDADEELQVLRVELPQALRLAAQDAKSWIALQRWSMFVGRVAPPR